MKSNFELVRAANDAALAEMVARRWLPQITPPYAVALSGGRIAVKFFQALAAEANGRLRHPAIHFFFADERCVPPDDPDSNYRLVHEHLINSSTIAPAQVHRLATAEQASRELLEVCAGELDMVFLGMGEDGHVASLFPGDLRMDTPDIYRPVVAPKPPPERLTIGLPPILAARDVWVLVSGPGKEQALQQSLEPAGKTPLARVLQRRAQTVIYTDLR